MLKSDADSGRSSCSAGSSGVTGTGVAGVRTTREASTNTDLQVHAHPRTPHYGVPLPLPSPARIFPPNRQRLSASQHDLHDQPSSSLIAPRKGGLTNAFSTIDLVSSTQIEGQTYQPNSLNAFPKRDCNVRRAGAASRLKVRRQPVQRAASRLYKVNSFHGKSDDICVGPEFIVRATHPSKRLDITTISPSERRTVVVILLNGQKIDVACDPATATAGEVFQAIIQSERFDHNFMLGISAVIGGDFIFLPDDYRIKKVAPDLWCGYNTLKRKSGAKFNVNEEITTFTLFLRIKFFMPANLSKAVRGGTWRSWVYLQLRRSIVEGQITLQLPQLVELAGYALQAEFGNYSHREHASGDYFILEHYLPEGSFSNEDNQVRFLVKQAHESHKNVRIDEAKEKFISYVQTFKDYGSHFYTAIWATSDGFTRDVWLSISPRGMILYSRNTCITALPRDTYIGNTNSRVLLQSLAWQHIHTLYYNKRTLYVVPNNKAGSGNSSKSGSKFKLKLDSNKSYFTFWLASLHHRFYMRLHADINSLLNISDEFSIPLECGKRAPNEIELNSEKRPQDAWMNDCSNFHDSYNLAVRGKFKVPNNAMEYFQQNDKIEEIQNKENEKPLKTVGSDCEKDQCGSREFKCTDYANVSSSEILSSPESCSLPRRLGVKMGTRVFNGSNHSTAIHHKQFHSLDASHIDHSNQVTFSPERLVQSDVDLTSVHSDSDDPSGYQKPGTCNVNRMNILPQRNYASNVTRSAANISSAYVIESPKSNNNTFAYRPHNDETLMNSSLQDRLNSMGCVQSERHFKTVSLVRGTNGALGMQVAEGSDGNVYVKSITAGGPAYKLKQIYPGDQIISVNGQTLLNLNYNRALSMLQNAPKNVEIILLQTVNAGDKLKSKSPSVNFRKSSLPLSDSNIVAKLLNGDSFSKLSLYNQKNKSNVSKSDTSEKSDRSSKPQRINVELNDDMLNVEALKTINVLLALTKRNIERNTSVKGGHMNSERTQSSLNVTSDGVLDSPDAYQYSSSTESTPSKKHRVKHNSFSMIHREVKNYKRRPLSVHIPSDVNIFDTTLDTTISSVEDGFNFRTRSCDNITVLKANQSIVGNANSLSQLKLTPVKNISAANDFQSKLNQGLPKIAAYSRKWAGHVKYPVTPSKVALNNITRSTENDNDKLNQFVYENSFSDEEQIFI
ncbi:tyrosine-protein phosphatase non-receptor type 13-like isoform X2 [Arctopsyche grandis]|uniref:tyrosine-protein phosphatase non-receptor type 13-like isoform X2 n=1 Tax=Arctopsyche grandis TaxID=121162 RepID=UPI00406D8885